MAGGAHENDGGGVVVLILVSLAWTKSSRSKNSVWWKSTYDILKQFRGKRRRGINKKSEKITQREKNE